MISDRGYNDVTDLYGGLTNVSSATEVHLGGNIVEGDPFTFSPLVWSYVIKRFSIRSVLDLGAGAGYSSEYFHREGLQVIATDGLKANCEKSVHPSVCVDLTRSSVFCRVDLVHCQEVVEHVEERYIENVLDSLCCGKFILLTHAVPAQAGHHHVNLQLPEYWIDNLRRRGCEVLVEDTNRIRKLANNDGAVFLAHTGLMLVNKGRAVHGELDNAKLDQTVDCKTFVRISAEHMDTTSRLGGYLAAVDADLPIHSDTDPTATIAELEAVHASLKGELKDQTARVAELEANHATLEDELEDRTSQVAELKQELVRQRDYASRTLSKVWQIIFNLHAEREAEKARQNSDRLALHAEREAEKACQNSDRRELGRILQSSSWRFTAPFRALRNRLRKLVR